LTCEAGSVFKTYVNASAGVGGPAGMTPVMGPSQAKAGKGGWEPSVFYLVVLAAAEIAVVAWISKHL
jgi:hypothetical protein